MNSIRYVEQAKEIQMLRKEMGYKALEIASLLNTDQPYYSRMENGYAPNDSALLLLRNMYSTWLKMKLINLNAEIERLTNIERLFNKIESNGDSTAT